MKKEAAERGGLGSGARESHAGARRRAAGFWAPERGSRRCSSGTATLSVLSTSGADLTLRAVLFGESVLNDAVAIVLFQTLQQFSPEQLEDPAAALSLVGRFVGSSLGSTAIGFAVALLLSRLLRSGAFNDECTHIEVALTISAAYVSYAAAQALELSGILSLFF